MEGSVVLLRERLVGGCLAVLYSRRVSRGASFVVCGERMVCVVASLCGEKLYCCVVSRNVVARY